MPAGIDPLDDALNDLRITGSLLLHESYAAPWAIDIPDERRLRAVLGVEAAQRVVLFHFVRRGGFELHMPETGVATLSSSQVAICTAGTAHRMTCGQGAQPMSIERVLRGRRPAPAPVAAGDETELVCGAFFIRASPLNPLLGALPRLMTVNTGDAASSPMLAGVAWMLAHEVDRHALGGYSVARLLELFCAEAIRAYQREAAVHQPGWFKGLADPRMAEAIGRVHAEPGRAWTVDELASGAALSASRFAARFKAATGISVMTYVSRWRTNVACRLLLDARLPLAEIACRVGYESQAAFSRAFKAQLGQPPAVWRADRLRRSQQ